MDGWMQVWTGMDGWHRGRQMNEQMCGWMIDCEMDRKRSSRWRMMVDPVSKRMEGWRDGDRLANGQDGWGDGYM